MIRSLLIANRGEIACRVIRTARAMGVRTVAVYSDADAHALHVRQADEAVHIGPSPAAESYLRRDRIIAAAKATGAEAIHPGYGFLSENADFAQAVIDAGLVWVGPRPESIRAMGLKDAAKKLMMDAGVPVTPGYLGNDQSPKRLQKEADSIGYPVLIKAVAGGGGKGMRKVDDPAEFLAALESCQREANSSFGDSRVLLEKWITSPRHIEVQVFGDSHGNVVHLFERDCSLQRRHQKVIEEAPAPGMDEATREAICAAAVRAAKAVDYVGAGTIEFIADGSAGEDGRLGLSADRIFFMEMNTRLQVEHPVTEEITGVDLVEWQLRVASGEPLPLTQDELSINGHAIEARLYAEDPAKGFLPSTGRLDHLQFDEEDVRVETGVEEGDDVSSFYDPMIAKIIVHRQSREHARERLKRALAETLVWPIRTNKGFLFECLDTSRFANAHLDTDLIASAGASLVPPAMPSQSGIDDAATVYFDYFVANQDVSPAFSRFQSERFPANFRLNRDADTSLRFWINGLPVVGHPHQSHVRDATVWDGDSILLTERGEDYVLATAPSRSASSLSAHDGDIHAPMPGKVIAVDVAEGQQVEAGQRLMVLEAMKMEHALTAPFAGIVAELAARVGSQVQVEAMLARVQKREE